MNTNGLNNNSSYPGIADLMSNFRKGLLSLVPVFEKAKIDWRDIDQFDESDEIAEALFNLVILNPIEQIVKEKFDTEANLAKYNFYHNDYSKLSFIQALTADNEVGTYFSVISLSSESNPYDTLYCNKIDRDGKIMKKGVTVKFENAVFKLQCRMPDGSLNTI